MPLNQDAIDRLNAIGAKIEALWPGKLNDTLVELLIRTVDGYSTEEVIAALEAHRASSRMHPLGAQIAELARAARFAAQAAARAAGSGQAADDWRTLPAIREHAAILRRHHPRYRESSDVELILRYWRWSAWKYRVINLVKAPAPEAVVKDSAWRVGRNTAIIKRRCAADLRALGVVQDDCERYASFIDAVESDFSMVVAVQPAMEAGVETQGV